MNVVESLFTEYSGNIPTYKAGRLVPSGSYVEIETGRAVYLDKAGVLPASFDGHTATYARLPLTWSHLSTDAMASTEC